MHRPLSQVNPVGSHSIAKGSEKGAHHDHIFCINMMCFVLSLLTPSSDVATCEV